MSVTASPAVRRATVPSGTTTLATRSSVTLSTLLTPFLKLSNNSHAEVLVKAIGRRSGGNGTWSSGLGAVTTWLGQNGVATAQVRLRDGSGLSRLDLLTPGQVANLLVAVRGKPWYSSWYAALPVAGNPDRIAGGTLRTRMVGTAAAGNVHAKTGSMTSVSALSGYVTNASGRPMTFSIMLNDYLASYVKDLEDRIAVALAESEPTAAVAAAPDGGTLAAAGDGSTTVKRPRQVDDPRTAQVDEAQLECSWVNAC